MSNLKKILALVLVLVMSFSLVSVSSAAYADADQIDPDYAEAVQVLTDMGIFKGDNGNFKPKALITREEVATMLYRVISKDTGDTQDHLFSEACTFEDTTAEWSKGYIGYCANGNYIKGVGGNKFAPKDAVTGVQVLAIILRAVGYDKKGEFTGLGWDNEVLTIAADAGVLATIDDKVESLKKPATRELVAELIFRTMVNAQKVTYTPAYGYQVHHTDFVDGKSTIGTDNFGLDFVGLVTKDDWGRPTYRWVFPKNCVNKKSDFDVKVSYETFEMVDECEISHAMGDKSYAIESAWIDGKEMVTNHPAVTSDMNKSIDALATTSMVGAQGRETEVYLLRNGKVRLVEINTYLAKVTAISAPYVDKNNHPIPSVATLEVYVQDGTNFDADAVTAKAGNVRTVYTSDVSHPVGSYVLVKLNLASLSAATPTVADKIVDANIVPAGSVVGWTNRVEYHTVGTTTLSATQYKDADKFVLEHDAVAKGGLDVKADGNHARKLGGTWDVALDNNGNAIGLIPSSFNFLVVEKIRFVEDATVAGGVVKANVVLANGERLQDVTVGTVNGLPATFAETFGATATAKVADTVVDNGAYYTTITTYYVDANGIYHLDVNKNAAYDDKTGTQASVAEIKPGTVKVGGASFNDNTVFAIKNQGLGVDTYNYTVVVGKNNIPHMKNVDFDYVNGADGYAAFVMVDVYTAAGNTFVAYVESEASTVTVDLWTGAAYVSHNAFNVWKLGETAATTIYNTATTITNVDADGLYKIELNQYGVVVSATALADEAQASADAAATNTADGISNPALKWNAGYVEALVGTTLVVDEKAATTGTAVNFGILPSTQVYVIERNNTRYPNVVIKAGEVADLTATPNSSIIVGYNDASIDGVDDAALVIYVVKNIVETQGTAPTTPGAPVGAITIESAVANKLDGTYTNKTTAAQTVKFVWQYRLVNAANTAETGWATYATQAAVTDNCAGNSTSNATTALTQQTWSTPGATTENYEVRVVAYIGTTAVATSNVLPMIG